MPERPKPKVILIGGAPMTGKSTLGRALAARLGYGCLSTDDLGQAINALTTTESHPALHEVDGADYREYCITRSVPELIADAERRHAALWPAIAAVITAHAAWWDDPTLIEGWALYPARVAGLGLPDVASVWLVADDEALEARLRAATDFISGVSDEQTLIRNFLARSRWQNARISREAAEAGLPAITVSGQTETADIVARCSHLLV
jgi:2-phosphoglycerate kinase